MSDWGTVRGGQNSASADDHHFNDAHGHDDDHENYDDHDDNEAGHHYQDQNDHEYETVVRQC